MKKWLLCIVGTGSTITTKFDFKLGGHTSAASAQNLLAAIPELSGVADIRVFGHSSVNSALKDTPAAFGMLHTLRIVPTDDTVTGIVVTRGTATL